MRKPAKLGMGIVVLVVLFALNSLFSLAAPIPQGPCPITIPPGQLWGDTCKTGFIIYTWHYLPKCKDVSSCYAQKDSDDTCEYEACDSGLFCAIGSKGLNAGVESCNLPSNSPEHCAASGRVWDSVNNRCCNANFNTPCGTTDVGECSYGAVSCDGTTCVGEIISQPETCDGKDNDCNGEVDNGLSAPLNDLQAGVCAGSQKTCSGAAGWLNNYAGIPYYETTETSCDNKDNDCDGQIDEGLKSTVYQDADKDGYGNPTATIQVCPASTPYGYVSNNQDCDDTNAAIHPGAAEICDGKDNDCNGEVDNGLSAPLNDLQAGVCAGSQKTCSGAAGWQNSYASIPGYTATETTANCDGTDNDCDGQTDEGCACISGATQNCGPATDAGECVYGTQTCSAGAWGICVGAVMPSQETCDNKDNDCDGQTDEGCDDDNDNYCDSSMTRVGTPSTCTAVGGDCNDANAAIHPGATEICDNKDNNCDATIDEGFDLQTDMNNCGSCNNVCAAGENCIAGVCTPPQILSQCSDSIDNDNNGCADYPTDSGCYGLTDMTEVGGICPVALSDTSDNDFTICHGPDSDNDGICDRFDNCWHGPNPDQADADGDCEAKKLLPEYWDGTGWLQDPKCGDACVCTIPYDGMEVTEDTLLCKGEYGITDAQKDGVIKMMKNGVTLDCNDAIIRSKAKCNLPGDANYNGYYDYEDVYLISQIYDKIYNEYITQFDSCGDDINQDGVVDENEHKGVASAITNHIKSVDCTAAGYVKGDYNENGMLDNHDLLIYYSLPGIDIEPACGDVNGDGVVDGDDATAINTEISSSLAIDRDRKTCTRYGNEYPLGDVSYNGIVDYADINLISAMNNGRTDVDYCGDVDGDDAVTPIDINILHNQINFNSPPCGLVGDINRNNRLEGGDLYLLQEMASGSIPPDMICGNVHEDGVRCTKTGEQTIFKPGPSDCSLNPCPSGYTCNPRRLIDQNDADALLDKMSVNEGTGISLADFNGVTIKNCNIYNYTYGIKVENSDSSIFHHNQLYNTNYDIYFDADSDGTQLYYNHLYKTGVNPEESACTAEDLAADLCNDYCSLIDEKEIGNYYGRDVGVINNLATGVVKDENIGHDDCGVVEITKPSPNEKLKTDQVDITFRRQTSKNTPLTYYLDYSTDNKATWNKIEGTATNPMTDTLAEDYTYHWSTSFIYQALDIRITPFDNYLNATPSMLHFEIDRRGNVEGKVQCCEGADCEPVDGAEVCYLSQCSPPAGEDGIYLLENVPSGMQSIVASSAGRRSQKKDVEVKAQDIVGADFTNVCPVTVDCNPDCTVVGTEKDPYPICEPTCDGVNGCDIFSDETAKVSCGYAARGSRMEYKKDDTTYYAVCCEGPWYKVPPEEKSKFVVDAENIARTTRIVYKGGRPVRMIVVTWD